MPPSRSCITALRLATALLLAATIESRVALAADVTWIDGTGGNFNDPANWSSGQVPGLGDRALITLAGTYTVNVGSVDFLDVTHLVLGAASALRRRSGGSFAAHTLATPG